MIDKAHIRKVKKELKDAGMTAYGFLKLTTGYLPSIIHENEHIKGVVYGRAEDDINAVMLVATDHRIIFLDCRPFYRNWDEITYEVVAGVKMSVAGPFAGIVLHTRVKDYSIRFVNMGCANKFVKYIEQHIEKRGVQSELLADSKKSESAKYQKYKIDHETPSSKNHSNDDTTILDNTAVLSTTNKAGDVHASVVHYITDKDENFYFLTKSDTTKVKNIESNSSVALTIHPSESLKVLYIKGTAVLVDNKLLSQQVFEHIVEPRNYIEGIKLPPITKINRGVYVAYKITPTDRNFIDYSESSW